MALPAKLAYSIPTRFTKNLIPLVKRSSSFITIRSFNVPCPIQCSALNQVSNDSQAILLRRQSSNFEPSVWHYDHIQSLSSEYKEDMYAEQSRVLKEEVRKMLYKVENHHDQLDLIDVLQRLGVAYHFKNEIRNILDNIYKTDDSKKKRNLHATALEFRLLREHGYDISTDVFVSFRDEIDDFKKCQAFDVEGMLSLYEASFYSWEGETILDELRDFTSKILKAYLDQNEGDDYLSLLISHALELPLNWRVSRWEARWFTHAYERRQTTNPTLLQLAKLDFNIVQNIYLEELKCSSRWWKRVGLAEKLSFTRDRLVESYFWTVETNFQPDFEFYRTVITKVNCLIVTIDDCYDSYGTLEELELFTEAIDRWDPKTIDNLPDYMKICFLALYNFVNELAFEFLKMNGYNIIPCLKNAWTDICKSYLTEAKWYHSGYKPSSEEYIENAWRTIGMTVILVHAYFALPHSFRKEDLVYLDEFCDIIRLSATISRLINDLGTNERESEMGDVLKLVQCYMNETGSSEVDAKEDIKSMLISAWKQMNKEAHNSPLSQSFIKTAVNLTRMAMCMYYQGDGHTSQDPQIKNRISSLLIEPIPIMCRENLLKRN